MMIIISPNDLAEKIYREHISVLMAQVKGDQRVYVVIGYVPQRPVSPQTLCRHKTATLIRLSGHTLCTEYVACQVLPDKFYAVVR